MGGRDVMQVLYPNYFCHVNWWARCDAGTLPELFLSCKLTFIIFFHNTHI